MDGGADIAALEAQVHLLRGALARRQEAVANLLQRVAEAEASLAAARRTSQPPPAQGPPPQRYGSIKAGVLDILSGSPAGISSVEVGRALRERLGDGVAEKTHLTTLRRLEVDGLARRMDGVWVLTPAGSIAALGNRTWSR